MKNKKYLIFIVAALCFPLTSCGLFDFGYETYDNHLKRVEMYNIAPNIHTIKDGYVKDVDLRFIDGIKYIPYLTIEDYANIIPFKKGVESNFSSLLGRQLWTVTSNDSPVFMAYIDYADRTIGTAGSLLSVVENGYEEYFDSLTVTENVDLNGGFIEQGGSLTTYSFKDYDFKIFKDNGKYYFPLGFLDLNFSNETLVYFFYNNRHLYRSLDVEQFSSHEFSNKDGHYTTVVNEYWGTLDSNVMPSELIKYNSEAFLYMMENMYGLKSTRHINSMKAYYVNNGIYEGLISNDPSNRGLAYSYSVNKLEDDHSGLLSSILSKVWNEELSKERGETSIARHELEVNLRESRSEVYKKQDDIIYSEDGKTASFIFDNFAADTKENVERGYYLKDSFEYVKHQFNEISAKEGVENVIIDMSTNGGGIMLVMYKILALISKNNVFRGLLSNSNNGQVIEYYGSVDSNDDKKYEYDDCYGDDFNIYLLTSNCSFSCGNAMPYIAKLMGNATLIGKKTGGGECAVEQRILPNLQYVQISSHNHITFDDENDNYYQFEDGIEPDIELEYDEFYDIEKIANKIKGSTESR